MYCNIDKALQYMQLLSCEKLYDPFVVLYSK